MSPTVTKNTFRIGRGLAARAQTAAKKPPRAENAASRGNPMQSAYQTTCAATPPALDLTGGRRVRHGLVATPIPDHNSSCV